MTRREAEIAMAWVLHTLDTHYPVGVPVYNAEHYRQLLKEGAAVAPVLAALHR